MRNFKLSLVAASVLACSTGIAATDNSGSQGVSVGLAATPVDLVQVIHNNSRNVALLQAHSKANSDRASVNVSGRVAFDAAYTQDDRAGRTDDNKYWGSVDISTAKLSFDANVNRWVSGFVSLGKDKDFFHRHGTFDVQQAYVTIGNLNSNPLFVTVGDMSLPFVGGANYMVTDTLAEQIGANNQTAVDVGYTKNGVTLQAYAYKGQYKKKAADQGNMTEGGAALDFNRKVGMGTIDLGVAYTSNMANNNLFTNSTFSVLDADMTMTKRIGGFAATGRLDSDKFDVNVSYVAALRKVQDVGFTSYGQGFSTGIQGKPSVLDVQAVYKATLGGNQWFLGADYAKTKDARNITRTDLSMMPEHSWSLIADAKLWKNTLLALQYRNDTNYKTNSFFTRDRKKQHSFQAQFNVYF